MKRTVHSLYLLPERYISLLSAFCPRIKISRWWRTTQDLNVVTMQHICMHASDRRHGNNPVSHGRAHVLCIVRGYAWSSLSHANAMSSWQRFSWLGRGIAGVTIVIMKHALCEQHERTHHQPKFLHNTACFDMVAPITTWEQNIAAIQGMGFANHTPARSLSDALAHRLVQSIEFELNASNCHHNATFMEKTPFLPPHTTVPREFNDLKSWNYHYGLNCRLKYNVCPWSKKRWGIGHLQCIHSKLILREWRRSCMKQFRSICSIMQNRKQWISMFELKLL